jgi:hypothetical protein
VCLLHEVAIYGATLIVMVACNGPARGPESKSAVIVTGPSGCDEGTRTEAWQNVPQEKPEWAVAIVWPSVFRRFIWAARSSWVAGDTGFPQ